MPSPNLVALLAGAALASWLALRYWQRRAGARRIAAARAMSGDVDLLVPDHESTLGISIGAPAATVWDALLRLGWPTGGRRTYEWLGRLFGFLEAPAASPPPGAILVGRGSQIPVRAVDPCRTLVLGADRDSRQWIWQFEITPLDEHRTRLILRDRMRVRATISGWLFLSLARAFSFVLTRKMLLDVKRAAEVGA